jgi:hypothetical protein
MGTRTKAQEQAEDRRIKEYELRLWQQRGDKTALDKVLQSEQAVIEAALKRIDLAKEQFSRAPQEVRRLEAALKQQEHKRLIDDNKSDIERLIRLAQEHEALQQQIAEAEAKAAAEAQARAERLASPASDAGGTELAVGVGPA